VKHREQGIIDKFDELTRLVARTFHASGACCLIGFDLTIQQFMVLNIVHRLSDPKMTDLSDELNVTLGNVTALVNRLIRLKYLKRLPDATDRRIVRVCLTVQGRELVKRAEDKRHEGMELMLRNLSGKEKRQLLQIMEKLAAALKKEGEINQ